MDFLRTPNANLARIVLDSGEEFWVRWYRAADGAKAFPGWHAFGSQYWEHTPDFEGPGNLKEPIVYRRERYPAPPGQEYHGRDEWYRDGLPADQLGGEEMTEVCGQPAQDTRGGVVLDGVCDQEHQELVTLITVKSTLSTLTTTGVLPLDASGTCFRLSSTGPVDITGLDSGVDGRLIVVENVGLHPITFLHQDPSAPAGQRIISMDAVSAKLYPRYGLWMQYDGTDSRWRELRSVPLVTLKGDLITHDGIEPSVLHTSGADGNVLTEDSTALKGMAWKPPQSATGRDWWYWPPGAVGTSPVDFWIPAGSVFGSLAVNETVIADQVIVLPLPRPRGGTIDKVGLYADPVPSSFNVRVGFYENTATPGICYPGALISGEEFTVSAAGRHVLTLASPVAVAPGGLLWVAILIDGAANLASFSSVTAPGAFYPIFGFVEGVTLWDGPQVGVGLGIDYSGMGPGSWAYGDGLPDPFPAPDDGDVSYPTAAGIPTIPAIMLHQSA